MKCTQSLFLAWTCVIVTTGPGLIAQENTVQGAKILNIETELLNAIASGDTIIWNRYLHDDCIITAEDGSRHSKHDIVSSMRPLPEGYGGHITIVQPRVDFRERIAIVNYVADELESVFGQNLHTTYATMNVYLKADTSWKLVASQIFEIPKNPPATQVAHSILAGYAGVYELSKGITFTVSIVDSTLYGQRSHMQREALLPETENVFFRKSDTRGRKMFVKSSDGTFMLIDRRNGNDIVWKRVQ